MEPVGRHQVARRTQGVDMTFQSGGEDDGDQTNRPPSDSRINAMRVG